MMTRKDYVAVAEILNSFQDVIADQFTFEDLVNEFADFFASDNPNFKRDKFTQACEEVEIRNAN
jgi:hypothetical protein